LKLPYEEWVWQLGAERCVRLSHESQRRPPENQQQAAATRSKATSKAPS
jgi:hypothetical protein